LFHRQLAGKNRNEDHVVDAKHDLERGQRHQRDQAVGGQEGVKHFHVTSP
jgi:hypothetical protein